MFYPIMMDICGRDILIVGGGKVAYRKAKNILQFGGNLTIVSPEVLEDFKELKTIYPEKLNFIYSIYDKKYIENMFLVIGATSSKAINEGIGHDCKNLNILVNLVDSKEDSDFITPSVINNDNLTIAISTMGSFPYLSRKIRKDMEKNYKKFDKEYMDLLEEIRYYILDESPEDIRERMGEILELDLNQLKNLLKSYKGES